jgi:hypothetical protein
MTARGRSASGSFEAEGTRRDRRACVEGTRSAVDACPSDGETMAISNLALQGRVS